MNLQRSNQSNSDVESKLHESRHKSNRQFFMCRNLSLHGARRYACTWEHPTVSNSIKPGIKAHVDRWAEFIIYRTLHIWKMFQFARSILLFGLLVSTLTAADENSLNDLRSNIEALEEEDIKDVDTKIGRQLNSGMWSSTFVINQWFVD